MATIRKTEHGTWKVAIRRKGHQPLYKNFKRKTDAEYWARKTEKEIDTGSYQSRKNEVTLREALDRYAKEVTPTKNGAKQEKNRIEQIKRLAFVDKAMSEVTSSDIANWRDKMVEAGKKPPTIKNLMMVVSGVYRQAKGEWDMGYLDNPCSNVRRPKKAPPRERRLHPGDEDLLMQTSNDTLRLTMVFAIETSARLGEIVALEKANVDRRLRTATVHDKVGQHEGRRKRLPLTKRALAAIDEAEKLHPHSAYVFCSADYKNKGAVQEAAHRISQSFKNLKNRKGFEQIKDLMFRDLRHEAISRFFEKGLSVIEVMSITGHTNPGQLDTYTHLYHQQDLASRLD